VICKNCGLDGGETSGLFEDDNLKCGSCGAEFEVPIIHGQIRQLKKPLIYREFGINIPKGTRFKIGKIDQVYTKVKSDHRCLKELMNIYILEKTEVVIENS